VLAVDRNTENIGAIMNRLAEPTQISAAAGRKAELIGPPMNIAVVDEGANDDGGNLVARVRMNGGWAHWLIRACVYLFAGSALLGQQAQFQGSVPTGVASPTPLSLTLRDAIDRGLKTNLGLLLSGQASETARGERLRSLSALLPQVTGAVSENVQQIDLQTRGIDFHLPGGFSTPTVVGPFQYTDARAYASFSVFDYSLRKSYRATKEGERAAQLSVKDARDLVVQSVANAYLLVIAGSSRVHALRAQVETDQAIYARTADQKRAGTAAAIDVLRTNVELQQEQQQLIAQENQVAKDKLALGRVIGLPPGQQVEIADTQPYSPLAAMTPDQALRTAYEQRADFQSAKASVRAADDSVAAARAERYPNLGVAADYGDVGTTPNNSHGTFTFQAFAKFNIFDGGRISGDIVKARSALKQRQDELADLGGQIDYQVRAALLDIQSAADQVAVARSNLDLANQTLTQAQDRYASGVTDTIEVVLVQGSVAVANDNLIGALYAHNLAKVELARSLGSTEQQIQKFMEVK
jgi:outer membrane protein TolC